ncbi:MAG: WG repeat-containing protein [Ginsengibacter sp.]
MHSKRIFPVIFFLFGIPFHISAQQVKYLIPPTNNYTTVASFSEGLACVHFSYNSVGFLNTMGNQAFPNTYEDAGSFHCGRAWVRKTINGKTKFGFINNKGKLVIPYIYVEVEDFSCNRSSVNKEGVWAIINKDGKTIFGDSLLIIYSDDADHLFR